jgi:lysophospholipase L1-like esterase
VDGEVFFAMPTLEGNRRQYQAGFKKSVEGLVLGPLDREAMKEFVGKEFWFDGVHPTGAGAERFSKWLARELEEVLN